MTQGSASYDRVLVIGLLSVLGLFTYLYLKMVKDNKKYTIDLEKASTTVKPPTVSETINAGYNKSMATLSVAEVKKYSGWIDRIETIIRSLNGDKKTTITANKEMVYNASVLKGMSDPNLKAIITYWEMVRKRKIESSLLFTSSYLDTSETLPALLRRILDLSI